MSRYLVLESHRNEIISFFRRKNGVCILLVGGTGLIGRWIIEVLGSVSVLGVSLKIIVTGRSRPEWLRARHGSLEIQFVNVDIQDSDSREFFLRSNITFNDIWFLVAPSAAETNLGMKGCQKYLLALHSCDFLDQLTRRSNVNHIFFASSGVAVADDDPEGVPENSRFAPDILSLTESHAYGKRVIERLLVEFAGSGRIASTSIGRIFSCYGPNLPVDLHYAVGNFVRDAMISERIILTSDGSSSRSFLYASDLVASILRLVSKPMSNSNGALIANIGSERAITIRELATLISDVSAKNGKAVTVQLGVGDSSVGNRVRKHYYPARPSLKSANVCVEHISLEQGLSSLLGYD